MLMSATSTIKTQKTKPKVTQTIQKSDVTSDEGEKSVHALLVLIASVKLCYMTEQLTLGIH